MKAIEIAERLRPFTKVAGTQALLPASTFSICASPSRISGKDLVSEREFCLDLSLTGPVRDFTLQMDLEKPSLLIWGHAREGYYRLRLQSNKENTALRVLVERADFPIPCGLNGEEIRLQEKSEQYIFSREGDWSYPLSFPRLSFGSHKKQDTAGIAKRKSMVEYFPFLHRLVEFLPEETKSTDLFMSLSDDDLQGVFEVLFSGLFVPQDLKSNLLALNFPSYEASPLELMKGFVQRISQALLDERDATVYLLPKLLKNFPCGRITELESKNAQFSIEWRKGKLLRVVYKAKENHSQRFHFGKKHSALRLRHGKKLANPSVSELNEFHFAQGTIVHMDRFH